jgi:hypothetical protein
MCHSSLCLVDFIVTLYTNASEETQVIPIEGVNKTCLYKEAACGRVFELVHILGVLTQFGNMQGTNCWKATILHRIKGP